MRRRKMLTGVLTAALLVGCISPLGVTGTEMPEDVWVEQLEIEEEAIAAEENVKSAEADTNELQDDTKEQVTGEEYTKSAEADANGFVIENGVLKGYTGEGGDVTIPDGVTSIGDSAFKGCSRITNITIPDSVTSIGECAFMNCNSLTSITIPKNADFDVLHFITMIFYGCSNLKEIEVDKDNANYTSENGILYDKQKKTLICCPEGKVGEVTIPNSVTEIGLESVINCNALTSISLPASVTTIRDKGFSTCSSLKEIKVDVNNANYASENGILYDKQKSTLLCCPGGKEGELTLPDSVTRISEYAFNRCNTLTRITLPFGVTTIEESAFSNCSSLTSIIIPDSVTSIEEEAFRGCSSLTSIAIPAGVTSIGIRTFQDCSSLTEINVAKENKIYTSENGILYNVDKSTLIQCPVGKNEELTIPAGVTSIGNCAFVGCISLTSIILPTDVTSIGIRAFEGCTSLTSITLPTDVTNIGFEAFYGCSEDFIIYCVKNSYAETYAKENNIKYKCIGEKDTQTITVTDNITKTYGDSAFSIGAATDGDGVLSYTSDNEAVAKVDSAGTITLTGAGTAHITVTASETDTYNAVEKVVIITVEKKSQTITASDITKTYGDSAFSIGAATDGDGVLSYVSDNEAVAKVDSAGTITLTGAGTAHITVTASETATYSAAKKVVIITVEKKSQTVTASDITKTYGDSAFSIGAATDGDGTLTYVSDDTSVATVDANGIVTLVNTGTAHITIRASETANYKATEKMVTITVNPAETASETPSETPEEEPENPSEEETSETPEEEPEKNEQTIIAKNITKTYGDKAFSLGAKTNGGGKLTYKILNTKIATINKSGKVTIKGCGRTQIKITAAANGNYQAATKTIILTVKPKKLTVTSVESTKSKALTVKWKQDKKAKGYIIEYSTDKKFKKNVKTATISKNSTVSKTVTKLKGGKKYYVRVCAYTTADGKKIKGSYSKVMSIKVKK